MDLLRSLSILLCLFLHPRWSSSLCDDMEALSGFLFSCQLRGEEFFANVSPETEIDYSVSVSTHPGRPEWASILSTVQPPLSYLYGTPKDSDVGTTTFLINALRRDTFATSMMSFDISIRKLEQGSVQFKVEFYLTNYTVDEFLSPSVLNRFDTAIEHVFRGSPGSPAITDVILPSSRGLLNPPPPDKLGVFVQVTPGFNVVAIATVSNQNASIAQQFRCDEDDSVSNPPEDYKQLAEFGFAVDWCRFKVFTVNRTSRSPSSGETVDLPNTEDNLSPTPLILISLMCLVITFSFIASLAVFFFGGRKQGIYMIKERQNRRLIIIREAQRTAREPAVVQRHLRDLAQLPRRRPSPGDLQMNRPGGPRPTSRDDGGSILEYQELTDDSSHNHSSEQQQEDPTNAVPPPSYLYPARLLTTLDPNHI